MVEGRASIGVGWPTVAGILNRATMTRTVECFFDVGSPASYLAWTQLPALCADTRATLRWRPMLLGAVFQATGNSSPASVPARGRYMTRDLQRCAQRFGVPFSFNPHFPIITLRLMRALTGLQLREPARLDDAMAAVYQAIWAKTWNLNDPVLVTQVFADAGFDPLEIAALTDDPAVKAALKTTTDEAVQRGVFGAPTFFVGDEMFFGQDRLDFVREALTLTARA
jgi:2-hydroxychromene-2-carboxylate isomerase